MLLGNFYHITSSTKEDQTFRVQATFNAAHPIFKGHFPELPVVPGVCQAQMLSETLSHLLGRRIEIKRAQHIKFLALLNPTKVKELSLEIKIEKEEAGVMLISATYNTPEETFFRFKGEMH
jgi:3-hydroxyacyl-[acyl-carrier-protein] dehydratase